MKVGDYVRTKYGIKQIYEIDNNKTVWKYKFKLKKQDGDGCIDLGCYSDSDDIKSSRNRIDLIEVGDYVNACPVLHKENNELVCGFLLRYKDKDIKSIVTHEQFSQMEYRIGE